MEPPVGTKFCFFSNFITGFPGIQVFFQITGSLCSFLNQLRHSQHIGLVSIQINDLIPAAALQGFEVERSEKEAKSRLSSTCLPYFSSAPQFRFQSANTLPQTKGKGKLRISYIFPCFRRHNTVEFFTFICYIEKYNIHDL